MKKLKKNNFNFYIGSRAYYLLFAILLSQTFSFAQVSVNATLENPKVYIGQKAKIELRAVVTNNEKINFPNFKDTITSSIEIRSISKIDTIKNSESNQKTYVQKIEIASFDTGYFAIPPFEFFDKSNNKKILSEALLFNVIKVPVDTTLAIKDIKGPMEAKIPWWDYFLKYIIAIVIAHMLVGLYFYLTKKKKVIKDSPKPIVIIPPHIYALEELNKLALEAIWKQGFYKEYHIRISEVLREYIEKRFGVFALEQTTDEIMRALKRENIDSESKAKLKQVLFLSDMVKFAKEIPIALENEQSIQSAIYFVEHTKQNATINSELNS